MKNYHALGILIAATIIFVASCSMALAADKAECPIPDSVNTGWVIVDTNGDGEPDRIFRIYNSGACVGQLVNPDDQGEPYEAS